MEKSLNIRILLQIFTIPAKLVRFVEINFRTKLKGTAKSISHLTYSFDIFKRLQAIVLV